MLIREVRSNINNKYLHPIRCQIADLVEPNTSVIELGCGDGDLLFILSPKIKKGIGLDHSKALISIALQKGNSQQDDHLRFIQKDILKESFPTIDADCAIACLFLHVLPWENAIQIASTMIQNCPTTIICGFNPPDNSMQRILLWLDQKFTPHYSNFKEYQSRGGTEGILQSIENIRIQRYDTFDPVIKIYRVTKEPRTKVNMLNNTKRR